jgi:hypothetical protein
MKIHLHLVSGMYHHGELFPNTACLLMPKFFRSTRVNFCNDETAEAHTIEHTRLSFAFEIKPFGFLV